MSTTAANDVTFDTEVLQSDIPVLVDFWAEWCGPCKQIAPTLEEISVEFQGRLKVVKVDIEESMNTPGSLGVRGIPALFMFKDGQVVSTKTGALPASALRSWVVETLEMDGIEAA